MTSSYEYQKELHKRLEDQEETIMALNQINNEFKNRIKIMSAFRAPDGLNELALEISRQVEDLFVQHHEGGRTQRLARVQVTIRDGLQKLLRGKKDWDSSVQNAREPIE